MSHPEASRRAHHHQHCSTHLLTTGSVDYSAEECSEKSVRLSSPIPDRSQNHFPIRFPIRCPIGPNALIRTERSSHSGHPDRIASPLGFVPNSVRSFRPTPAQIPGPIPDSFPAVLIPVLILVPNLVRTLRFLHLSAPWQGSALPHPSTIRPVVRLSPARPHPAFSI